MMLREGGEDKLLMGGGHEEYMNKTLKLGKYGFSGRTLLVLFDNVEKEFMGNCGIQAWILGVNLILNPQQDFGFFYCLY